ncbi:MAG: hypothetical protein GF409_07980 [Candidatus Omnitrophica bacterium]|nr:hypothetical protein [Candidatus Omnitrophota bacterium]
MGRTYPLGAKQKRKKTMPRRKSFKNGKKETTVGFDCLEENSPAWHQTADMEPVLLNTTWIE